MKKSIKMRSFGIFILALLFSLGLSVSVFASNDVKVVDYADLLTDSEEESLQTQYKNTADMYDCDVVLLTTDTCNGADLQEFTKEYFLQSGYGCGSNASGIILMVTMEERKFQLTTNGDAEWIFTNYGLNVIDEKISEYLSDGNYYDAFAKYGELAERFIDEGLNNTPYDNGNTYKEKMSIGKRILISIIVGIIFAAVTILSLMGQLKSVGIEKQAQEYVRQGSFQLTKKRDLFLYREVTRRKIEKQTKESSGNSSGGHTGSF